MAEKADLVQIKASVSTTGVTFLADREIAYSREEKALYIGDGGRRNQKLCSAETAAQVEALERDKLTATAAEAIAELPANSDINAVITAYNALLASLKSSGIMKEG